MKDTIDAKWAAWRRGLRAGFGPADPVADVVPDADQHFALGHEWGRYVWIREHAGVQYPAEYDAGMRLGFGGAAAPGLPSPTMAAGWMRGVELWADESHVVDVAQPAEHHAGGHVLGKEKTP